MRRSFPIFYGEVLLDSFGNILLYLAKAILVYGVRHWSAGLNALFYGIVLIQIINVKDQQNLEYLMIQYQNKSLSLL